MIHGFHPDVDVTVGLNTGGPVWDTQRWILRVSRRRKVLIHF